MRLGLGLSLDITHPATEGVGLPPLPDGYVFLVDGDGYYLTDADGYYLVEPV
jgi:hypothetical protein